MRLKSNVFHILFNSISGRGRAQAFRCVETAKGNAQAFLHE